MLHWSVRVKSVTYQFIWLKSVWCTSYLPFGLLEALFNLHVFPNPWINVITLLFVPWVDRLWWYRRRPFCTRRHITYSHCNTRHPPINITRQYRPRPLSYHVKPDLPSGGGGGRVTWSGYPLSSVNRIDIPGNITFPPAYVVGKNGRTLWRYNYLQLQRLEPECYRAGLVVLAFEHHPKYHDDEFTCPQGNHLVADYHFRF